MGGLLGSGVDVLAGCRGSTADAPAVAVTVRDSAGIRIVENRVSPDDIPVYAEIGGPELRIGVVDGDPAYTFGRIVATLVLADGSVLVADGQARELRLFDRMGSYVRTLGGPGDGPGEIAALSDLAGVDGDTAWVWDASSHRVTGFPLDGRPPVTEPLATIPTTVLRGLRRLGPGMFLGQAMGASDWDLPASGDGTRVSGRRLPIRFSRSRTARW